VHCRLGQTAAALSLAIGLSAGGLAARAEGAPPPPESSAAPQRPSDRPGAGEAGAPAASAQVEQPAERRAGLMLGLGLAAVVGGATGYPNDVAKIDNADFYTNTGVGVGGHGGLWLGWALADWVTFGLTVSAGALSAGGDVVRFAGGGVRVELFPAWLLDGPWQDLGVLVDAGIGFGVADAAGTSGTPLIESGGASHFAAGLFYEGIRAWQFSMGPFVAFEHVWSQSMSRPLGCLGWRAVYYSGP
jgi:hypothetical protein